MPSRASDALKRYHDTEFASGFKSLLTLLELAGASLHDEKITGMTRRSVDRHGGIGNGKRGVARPAARRRVHRFGGRGHRHRRRRHGRRRRLHQPRFSGQGHPVGLCDPAAVDASAASSRCAACFPTANSARCFRARAANTISSAAPFIRRSDFWRAGCRRRSASPRRWRWPRWPSGNTASRCCPAPRRWRLRVGVVWLVSIVQLTGVRHSSTFQLISTILKVVLIVAFLIAGFVDRHAAAGLVCAAMCPTSPMSPARRSRSASSS